MGYISISCYNIPKAIFYLLKGDYIHMYVNIPITSFKGPLAHHGCLAAICADGIQTVRAKVDSVVVPEARLRERQGLDLALWFQGFDTLNPKPP